MAVFDAVCRLNIGDFKLPEWCSIAIHDDMSGRGKSRTRAPEQLVLFKQHGGKRRGAGRPAKGERAGSPHKTRLDLSPRYPVHVTLRVVRAVGSLRRRFAYRAIREATLTTARRESFRIVQLSIQRTHLHLIVEADHKAALAAGLQGFQISAAKHLNAEISRSAAVRRRGSVFPDRYHAEIITSPRQARHALRYVMSNWRKHEEDRVAPMNGWTIDWFSSAAMFAGWREYGDEAFLWRGPETYDPLIVYQPRTWLLKEGWKKAGTISCRDVPSAAR
jgi:REP element-mobilizing transposase RayT